MSHHQDTNNIRLCACGCGKPTNIAKRTDTASGMVKGKPMKYLPHHHLKNRPRGAKSHAWKGGRVVRAKGYIFIYSPGHPHASNGYIQEHRLVAEKVLGRFLKSSEVVHHVDGDTGNNKNNNLVVCENDKYHKLVHKRHKAYTASGNPNWLMCTHCKKWDDPKNLHTSPNGRSYHKACNAKYYRELKQRKAAEEGMYIPDPGE